jgi:hypothetical protein
MTIVYMIQYIKIKQIWRCLREGIHKERRKGRFTFFILSP